MNFVRLAGLVLGAWLLALPAGAQSAQGVCSLLPTSVIQQSQGSAPVATRPTVSDTGKLKSEQCFYQLTPFTQSVSLQVISRSRTRQVEVRDFWKSRFHRDGKNAEREEETEEREGVNERAGEAERELQKPPLPVEGVGDEAYWVETGRDGALYALAGEDIVRISLGGNLPQQQKIEKASLLAKSAVAKLAKTAR